MSRGRSRGFGARPAPAPRPAGASVDVIVEVEAVVSAVEGRCLAEAEAILARDRYRPQPLALAPTHMRAGGVHGDVAESARDLEEAALWLAAGGKHESAMAMLDRAIEHQRRHVKRLKEALDRPRNGRNYGLVQRLGGLSSVRSRHEEAGRMLDALVRSKAGGLGGQDAVAILDRKALAIGELSSARLSELLADGALERARAFARALCRHRGDARGEEALAAMSEHDLELSARVVRFRRFVGDVDAEHREDLLSELAGVASGAGLAPSPLPDEHRRLIAPRLAGERGEIELDDAEVYLLGRWSDRPTGVNFRKGLLDPVASGGDVLAVAAGILRSPRRYERTSWGGPAPEQRGRMVRVEATPKAFGEFVAAQKGHPAYQGFGLSVNDGTLELSASLAARVGGDDIEIRCVLPLGAADGRRVHRRRLELAREHADWPAELVGEDAVPGQAACEDVLLRPYRFPEGTRRDTRPAMTTGALLGPEECEHRAGRWVPVGPGNQEPDGIALECPRCLRRRIAVVPAMSVPAGDPRAPEPSSLPHQLLLEREHGYRILQGLPALTDEQLEAELAAASPEGLDPARWASRPAEGTTTTRGRGLADVMRRGR